MALGSLCISIDVEAAWGIWDKPSDEYHRRCADHELEIVRRLAALFERYEASATWAIVGRLLERDGRKSRETTYGDRIWYAPEVIDIIRAARVPQDIGSHSYEHLYFGEASREQLRSDLAEARRVHEAHGLPFVSFVFPRNQVAHLDLVREAGIRVFRSVDVGWHISVRHRLGAHAGRVANLVDKLVPIPPVPVSPSMHDGLVELPSSMLLLARKGARRMVHPALVLAKAKRGLERARETGKSFHLWFHPSNFYYDSDVQFQTLARILEHAAAMRDRGDFEIRPMSSFAA